MNPSNKKFPVLASVLALAVACSAPTASAAVTGVVETGGDHEATDTVTAKWSGVTFVGGVANEPVPGLAAGASYTVGLFGNHAPSFVDRNHRYTNAEPVPIPAYLAGQEYIMSGQDNRDNMDYLLDITVNSSAYVYILVDNRLGETVPGPANSNNPPTFDATHMQWILDEGWTAVKTGANRASDPSLPDEVGIDESADGTINQYYSIYTKSFPVGTFQLKEADNAGQNMYGVVVSTQPPLPVPLVAEGAAWRYLADGSDQGTAWRSPGFSDASWPSGPSRLGFGGAGEATVIGNVANGFITFYFRKTFTVANAASIANLFGQAQVDDGVILYLNGTEIYRRNMPNTPVDFLTRAPAAGDGATFQTFLINSNALVNGVNVLAAEVHQHNPNSSDLGWNLDLVGNYSALPPVITIASPTNTVPYNAAGIPLLVNARDPDGTVMNVSFYVDGQYAGRAATAPFSGAWTNVTPGYHAVFAVATDNAGFTNASPVAIFTVGPPTVTVTPPPLVTAGAAWKYLADGCDQGTTWRSPSFPDASWPSGPSRLGFGGEGEATVVGDRTNGFITFYFRKTFIVANAASITTLSGQAQVDDGVILYLNGTEIYRRNMTNTQATLNYHSLASAFADGAEETTFWPFLTATALADGVNVLAAEVHQQSTISSDLGWNLELLGNYAGPIITIASPTNAVPYNAAGIPLLVNAGDPDGAVTNVDFYVDYRYAGSSTNPPFSGLWTNAALGSHSVFAWARDNAGLTAFSPVASFTVRVPATVSTLVNSNATWKYLDDGSDQGTAWRANGFNDTGWSNGVAEMGYGDGDEVTTVRSNRLDGTRIETTYFRKTFDVANPAGYLGLVVRLKRDDGGVVYLNGVEIFRSNMTNGAGVPVLYTDLAANAVDEVSFFSTNASASLLRAGDNVLAVEIHQVTLFSSDISFDLQLQGETGPVLSISRSGSVVNLNWLPAVPGLQLQIAPTVTGPWYVSPYQANPQNFTVPGNPPVFLAFWRLLVP